MPDTIDWHTFQRELITNTAVRKLCGGITRATLLNWRRKDFPPPVLTIQTGGNTVELWARSQVKEWLAVRPKRR